jgi:hypothetical protein
LSHLAKSVATGQRKLSNGELNVEFPIMRKLTLPRKHAPELLKLLRDEGVTTMSLFPGIDGVVRLLKEYMRELR